MNFDFMLTVGPGQRYGVYRVPFQIKLFVTCQNFLCLCASDRYDWRRYVFRVSIQPIILIAISQAL